jgi:hypothetical protein
MSQQDLLNDIIAILRKLGIEFMLSGSHASSLQGEVRATHDIDLVVKLSLENVDALFDSLNVDRFYLNKSAMIKAIETKRMFNIIEVKSGEKVDFWMLTDNPFDESRFSRRQKFDIGELVVDVSSPEDTILMKLHWCQQSGGSEKQLHDVMRVYELQADLLDMEYIHKWVAELGVGDLWQRVLDESDPYIPPPRLAGNED